MESFQSSDAYDDEAHQLYDEGRFDEALTLLREGLERYPDAVELHVGHGYARLARQEYAWARRAFQIALTLEPDHEDALTGMGEVLLAFGQVSLALESFLRVIQLGFYNDHELMLQAGKALYAEGYFAAARRFFESARTHHPDSPDVTAALGYTTLRLGLISESIYWLRRTLELDPHYVEPRIQLANLLYDRGSGRASLRHFLQTLPQDHFDEVSLWRVIELLRSEPQRSEDDPVITLWLDRLDELESEPRDPIDELFLELELNGPEKSDPIQLELFDTPMRDLITIQEHPESNFAAHHLIETLGGHRLKGSSEELVAQLQVMDGAWAGDARMDFMTSVAERSLIETGVTVSLESPEAFLRGMADAGWVRVLQ